MTTSLTPNHIRYALANLLLLTFEVTDACNLKCKYCGYGEFYNDYEERKDQNLPFGYARQLLDYLADFWNSNRNVSSDRNIYIGFYGGEPLLNMTFVKNVVDYVDKMPLHHRHFSFAMTTNAILLDKHMDYLAEKRFNLLVSLDGNAFNDSYRVDKAGSPSFDRVVRNVNRLRECHSDYFRQKVNFNAVLHNRNTVQEIHDFFKREYDKIPSIGELNNMGIREDKRELFNMTYRNQMESLMQSEHYEEIDKERFISSPTYQSVCTFLHQYCDFVYRDYNELLQLPDYCFCSRATTLSVGLALKCDETEAGRSENTLQSIKNYKSLANVKKNISLHKQFLHTFRDSIENGGKDTHFPDTRSPNHATPRTQNHLFPRKIA